jgi:hypothetical protein
MIERVSTDSRLTMSCVRLPKDCDAVPPRTDSGRGKLKLVGEFLRVTEDDGGGEPTAAPGERQPEGAEELGAKTACYIPLPLPKP